MQYCKFFKQFVFVKFEGLDDINDVEKYKRCPLKVTRENAVPLEEDEYYVADLLGLTIVDESGVTIGELVDVIETGANDVYEVKHPMEVMYFFRQSKIVFLMWIWMRKLFWFIC